MKALLQRVSKATVTTTDGRVGEIQKGLMILLCVEPEDTETECGFLADKITAMRVFPDQDDKMNLSLTDIEGQALVISQFTLAAQWRKGNRPGFSAAASPELAEELYGKFCSDMRERGIHVETGAFGQHMDVSLTNDGPVTIWLDTNNPV